MLIENNPKGLSSMSIWSHYFLGKDILCGPGRSRTAVQITGFIANDHLAY